MMIRNIMFAAAMAFPAFASAAPQAINLCTGGAGFPYAVAGQMIADAAKGSAITINVVNSKGTLDNISRTVSGAPDAPEACHAFIGQPDAVVGEKRKNAAIPLKQIASLHREYLHVLCGKNSGVDDLEDVAGGKHSVNIGPNGSGAWALWQNFIAEDDSYKSVPVKNETDKIALGSVASGDTDCMIVAAGLGNATMQEADAYYADDIVLVEATDWDFNDAKDIRGETLYEFVDMPSVYDNLQGWFGSKETVSWNAGVYVNPDRIADELVLGELITYVNRAKSGIINQFGK